MGKRAAKQPEPVEEAVETAADAVQEEAVEEAPKSKKGKYIILDSNGKEVRTAATEEEANSLAEVYGGRVKK